MVSELSHAERRCCIISLPRQLCHLTDDLGCNFKSLNQISPFLEPSTSGISSLWARTTALKYNTAVVVGYPEKVDVSDRWPTSPEYYNSAMLVNKDGETIANYRKSFLYATDERWALEGTGGFFYDRPQGLGRMAMGIGKSTIRHEHLPFLRAQRFHQHHLCALH